MLAYASYNALRHAGECGISMIGSLATCADLAESIQAEEESILQLVFKDVLEAIGDIT